MAPVERGALNEAADKLRGIYARAKTSDEILRSLLPFRDEVYTRYRDVFSAGHVGVITEEEFRSFLMFRNNRHWAALQRLGPKICSDIARLRQALSILVDESCPIRERLNKLIPNRGPAYVPGLGKAVLTPILLVTHPDRYGVWNQISEAALRTLQVWPELSSDMSFGERYETVNEILTGLVGATGLDRWALDFIFWRVTEPLEADDGGTVLREPNETSQGPVDDIVLQQFGLERHLQDFLRDNWDTTPLSQNWKIHEEDGDPEAGFEYPCDVGRIDILARHRTEPRWLVVELKRNQTSDQTVGQVLRYIGWVRRRLAKAGEKVEGLVIAREIDPAFTYALSATSDVTLNLYEVEFRLREPERK